MLEGGFIKLHRKITKWEWYRNANTFRVFVHLLLSANYESHGFEGRTIERGQCVTSVSTLSKELKLSSQSIRTALNHLKSTGEITINPTPKFSIITVNNYDLYQHVPSESTNDQQTANMLSTNDQQQWKKDKERKRKNKNGERGELSPHGTFMNVFLSDSEVRDLREKYPSHYMDKIDRLSRVIESKGRNYSNHYATLLDWLTEDVGKAHNAAEKLKPSYDIGELEEINWLEDYA